MTGYGRGASLVDGTRCVAECASVNRKGLEVACQMPREMAALEIPIREAVMKRVGRGRVSVVLSFPDSAAPAATTINTAAAVAAAESLRQLQNETGIVGDIDLKLILGFPGVIAAPDHTSERVWAVVEPALAEAMDALVEMRAREGAALLTDLRRRLATLTDLRREMCELAPEVTTKYRDGLMARLEKANLPVAVDETRLATEIALFAERSDVSEELTRLESHFAQFAEKLDAPDPSGRALEFLTQEIFRELNTLGSKAGDGRLSRVAVDAKVEIDKMREQILNVE